MTVRVTGNAGRLKASGKYVRGLGIDTDGIPEWALNRIVQADETFDVQTGKFQRVCP